MVYNIHVAVRHWHFLYIHVPTSTPRPLIPDIRTLDLAIFCMVSCPNTYLKETITCNLLSVITYLEVKYCQGWVDQKYIVIFYNYSYQTRTQGLISAPRHVLDPKVNVLVPSICIHLLGSILCSIQLGHFGKESN